MMIRRFEVGVDFVVWCGGFGARLGVETGVRR